MAKAFPDIKVNVSLDIDIHTAKMMCNLLNSFIKNNDRYRLEAVGIRDNYDYKESCLAKVREINICEVE